ncbi:hypothetical protein [Methylacidiphilum kamchatkense]|nr:hypothetical protein [Methylacidiphilum kamchatkense]
MNPIASEEASYTDAGALQLIDLLWFCIDSKALPIRTEGKC